ncbi:MAG: lipopolysaccharide biosynthesis protein [Burkholderiaceae bacterium]
MPAAERNLADGTTDPDGGRAAGLKQRALGGFLWLSMGNASRAVLKLTVIAILARLLVPAEFGLVAAASVVIWFSWLFATLGVGPALIQRPSLQPADVSTGFITTIGLGLLLGGLIFLLAPQLAELFRMPELTPLLQAMSVVVPIASMGSVSECLAQRELRFQAMAATELGSYAIGYGVVGIALAWLGFGVWALIGAELVKSLVKAVGFLLVRPLGVPMRFEARAFKHLMRFGSGYAATGVSTYLASQGDSVIVARFFGASALGVYARAYELMMVPAQALGVILDKILFPLAARVQGDPTRLALAYRRSMALIAFVVLPFSAATIVLAPEIVRVLLGPNWPEVIVPLQVLALAMYFRTAYMPCHSVAHAAGAVGRSAWRTALHAGLVVVAALVGLAYGVTGVAAGVVLAIAVNFGLLLQLGVRTTGTRWRDVAAFHGCAVGLACVVGAEAWLVAVVLRSADAPAVTILAAAVLVSAATVLAVVRFAPRMFGADGQWLVAVLLERFPRTMQPLAGKQPAP